MARDKDLVQLIRYQFSPTDLFANLGNMASRYKAEESVEKYIALCSQKLQQLYPNAAVEIIPLGMTSEETLSIFAETYVESWDPIEGEVIPDSEEPQIIDEILQRIWEGFDWAVQRNRVLVSQSQEFSPIPSTVLRWACYIGMIEGADKTNGFWDFPLDQLPLFREKLRFVDRSEILNPSLTQTQVFVCYLEKVADVPVVNLPLDVRFLVVPDQSSQNRLLQTNSSLFLVCRVSQNVDVKVEHFIDVEKWSHPNWTYRAYVNALKSGTDRRGIGCSYQEVEKNEKKEIDGISLLFANLKLHHGTTIRTLFDGVLNTLSEVINEAELSLAGGPTWGQAYEQDEERFCKEVLEPLLNKMGFLSVRYVHGDDEYGRDFIFAEETRFNELRHYGLQAKRGKISGGTKSDIDTILSQIQDAFAMPYEKEPKAESKIYISTMIIAISGEFTRNAIEKIRHKMPRYLVGSVHFWDKTKIRSLISQYWGKEKI